jgi:hypothetical protein
MYTLRFQKLSITSTFLTCSHTLYMDPTATSAACRPLSRAPAEKRVKRLNDMPSDFKTSVHIHPGQVTPQTKPQRRSLDSVCSSAKSHSRCYDTVHEKCLTAKNTSNPTRPRSVALESQHTWNMCRFGIRVYRILGMTSFLSTIVTLFYRCRMAYSD